MKKGNTKKKKNFRKEEGYRGNETREIFISKDNYGGSTYHISKGHYGDYEVVVLYN